MLQYVIMSRHENKPRTTNSRLAQGGGRGDRSGKLRAACADRFSFVDTGVFQNPPAPSGKTLVASLKRPFDFGTALTEPPT